MPPKKSQNILLVMADQLTPFALACYRQPAAKTPHLDSLAAAGVVFDAAYTNSPLCAPARCAFMTGRHISRCGGYDNAAYLPATTPTFAHYLRLAGYRTCLAGKMHFIGADQLHGFEQRLTTDIYPADFGWVPDWTRPDQRIDQWYHNMSSVKQAGVAAITNQLAYDDEAGARAVAAIYDHARAADPRPLCLVVGFIHPHDPYAARRRHFDLYRDADIPPPTVPRPPAADQDPHSRRLETLMALDQADLTPADITRARRAYFANVSYLDDWLGALTGALAETGMAADTTIIITSDHGDMLGEHGLWYKMSFREWSCRIPLIISRPARFAPRRVAQPVSLVDLAPTLLALAAEHADQPPPPLIDPMDGGSLLGLCDGDGGDVNLATSAVGVSDTTATASAATNPANIAPAGAGAIGAGDAGDGVAGTGAVGAGAVGAGIAGADAAGASATDAATADAPTLAPTPPATVISEYLAEGTAAPMLMLRRGRYKFITCPTDPDLLYDLPTDPNETTNLADSPAHAAITKTFRHQAAAHWNPAQIQQQVLADQARRRAVHAALAIGTRHSWDYTPPQNPAEQYTRSHHDLTALDTTSRHPQPPAFVPRKK